MTAVFAAKSERMMCAAHRQHGGARRKALVEDIDLGVRVAPELQDQQRQQHGFTGAGRPDDQHMADIANMGRKPERGRARSEEHTSELQSLMRISYAVFCLKKKNKQRQRNKQRN